MRNAVLYLLICTAGLSYLHESNEPQLSDDSSKRTLFPSQPELDIFPMLHYNICKLHFEGTEPFFTQRRSYCMTFGEKVRTARKARGLSQKELAQMSGIAVRTIINYESDSRMPKSKDSYRRLAEALDIDLSSLMDDNADFIIQSSEKFGSRGRRQAEKLVKDVAALYAGGELEERDMDAMMQAIQDAYWEAKKINRKYIPKKYHPEESVGENE